MKLLKNICKFVGLLKNAGFCKALDLCGNPVAFNCADCFRRDGTRCGNSGCQCRTDGGNNSIDTYAGNNSGG